MRLASLGVVLVVLLSGCAGQDRDACRSSGWATCGLDYRADKGSGIGHATLQLEPEIFRIRYVGEPDMSRETLQAYWLYRAAEHALSTGYAGFAVLTGMQFVAAPPVDPLLHRAKSNDRKDRTIIIEREVLVTPPPPPVVLQGDIRVLKAPVAAAPPRVFDAAKLKAELEPHVMGKGCWRGSVCPHFHRYLFPDGAIPGSSERGS